MLQSSLCACSAALTDLFTAPAAQPAWPWGCPCSASAYRCPSDPWKPPKDPKQPSSSRAIANSCSLLSAMRALSLPQAPTPHCWVLHQTSLMGNLVCLMYFQPPQSQVLKSGAFPEVPEPTSLCLGARASSASLGRELSSDSSMAGSPFSPIFLNAKQG